MVFLCILNANIFYLLAQMIELDDYNIEIRGNLLTGNLSGKWTDIRVNHGNVLMDQSFAKVPRYVHPDPQTNVW